MHGPENRAGDARRENADPGRAGVIGCGVRDHRAEHQRPFEPKIYAAGFFGQAFAERDEHERRRDPDGPAEHGDEDGDDGGFVHVRSRSFVDRKIAKRPYSVSEVSKTTKMNPCNTRTVASGNSMRR